VAACNFIRLPTPNPDEPNFLSAIAAAEQPPGLKLLYLLLVLVPTIGITFYTVARSKALSDFLEALSDERLGTSAKFRALLAVWRKPSRVPRDRT
jgi:hypothetical protein